MRVSGEAELRAAVSGRAALAEYLASGDVDEEMFGPADRAALAGSWSWQNVVVQQAITAGSDGMIGKD